jgi:hypothetical protein
MATSLGGAGIKQLGPLACKPLRISRETVVKESVGCQRSGPGGLYGSIK